MILFYGAVTKTVYSTLFLITSIITILCIIYWFLKKELPVFSKKYVIPALILLLIVVFQILSTVVFYAVSQGNYFNNCNPFIPCSADIYSTLQSLTKATSYFCIVFCFLTAFRSLKQKYRFLFYFCFIGFVISFFAIIKMIIQQYDLLNFAYFSKGFGPYINRNHFAGYSNMVIPACWALIALSHERSKKILGLFFIVITGSSLFLSLSRGGILSFFFSGFLTLLFVYKLKGDSYRNKRLSFFFGLLCIFLLLWWIGIDPVLRRLSTTLHFPEEPSFINRLWLSIASLGIIREFPLFGTGLGTLKYVFGAYKTSVRQCFIDYLHNDYFQFIVECGMIGFAVFLFYVYKYFKTVFLQIKRTGPSENQRYLWICSFSTAIALGVHSFVDFNMHIPANIVCFLVILSLPFDITKYTNVKTNLLKRNYIVFFILVIIQVFGTIISIDILKYESSVDKALRHTEFVFKHEALNNSINKRTYYSRGYYELGKAQFYEGLRSNKTELLDSSVANFEKAINREPRNTEYYLRIGVARYLAASRQKNDIAAEKLRSRALSDLHHAVKIDRTNGMMWYFYGSYLIKNWYDFWSKGDEHLRNGLHALSAAVTFRPSYLPKSFEKVLKIDNNYATLYYLLNTATSIKMLKKERLKRLAALHASFSKQLKKHIIEINFGTYSKTELLYSNELISMADIAMKQNKYEKALLQYEKVTKLPASDENKVAAHAGIARCLKMLQLKEM